MMIRVVKFADLEKCKGCKDEFNIILYDKANIVYFGLWNKSELVSIMAVEEKHTHYKFRANYTPKEYRGKGYNSILLKELTKVFGDKPILTEANNWSRPLYEKNGFIITSRRQCKYWVKYFMRREAFRNGKDGETIKSDR